MKYTFVTARSARSNLATILRLSLLALTLFVLALSLSGCKQLKNHDDAITGKIIADLDHALNDDTGKQLDKMDPEEHEKAITEPKDLPKETKPECGDGVCEQEKGESCDNCVDDCGCGIWAVCEKGECYDVECYEDRDCESDDSCGQAICLMAGTPDAKCMVEKAPCRSGDGCCPDGCSFTNDDDCPATSEDRGSGGGANVVCGDGNCDGENGENTDTCPEDCAAASGPIAACSDGIDNDNDTYYDYLAMPRGRAAILGDPECHDPNDNYEAPFCGNHQCEMGENASSCWVDCPMALVHYPPCDVGNMTCSPGWHCILYNATNGNCQAWPICNNTLDDDYDGFTDYPNDPECLSENDEYERPYCGDYVCEGHEHYGSCPDDCFASCGNGACEDLAGETASTCPADCSGGMAVCGDGTCNTAYESSATCKYDCWCGNRMCEPSEDAMSCPIDCNT